MRKMDLALQRKRRNQKKHRDWSVVFFLWNFTLLIHSSLSLLSKYTELIFESTQHNQTRRKKTDLLTHLLGLIISTVSVLHTHFGRCFGLTFEPRWLRETYSPFFHKMVERREKKHHYVKGFLCVTLNEITYHSIAQFQYIGHWIMRCTGVMYIVCMRSACGELSLHFTQFKDIISKAIGYDRVE